MMSKESTEWNHSRTIVWPASHLGGGSDFCWDDEGSLDWAIKTFEVKSMLDIGCGVGCQVKLARSKGLDSIGLDGDMSVFKDGLQEHIDFTLTKYKPKKQYDLIWSVEFLEHVDEEYIENYMPAFTAGKYIICTHALPGQSGHHHVNCQPTAYWIELFDKYGFDYNDEYTAQMKAASTMECRHSVKDPSIYVSGDYIRRNGLFFSKQK
jgi:SAM-dependent methyltransferase